PHDTGLVTLISQEMSEFALHVRAFTGMPINSIMQYGPSASSVILGQGASTNIRFDGLTNALSQPQTQVKLFGKPEIDGRRRLGVAITRRDNLETAIEDAISASNKINITY
ncbi:phosphoribosylglycinamide formyltransferase 2, partial [Aliivibrio sifiae]